MATKAKKRRGVADIGRLSAQTRLKAWDVFTELIRRGMDRMTALRKALQDACPPKDDPYYRSFYSNKMRELELWRRLGLWPLAKPKDVEHDTCLHDTVEVSTEVLYGVLKNGAGASSPALLPVAGPSEKEDRVDTLEFDPVEVAKIIESYDQDPALFAADTDEQAGLRSQGDEASEVSYTDRPVPLKTRAATPPEVDPVPETESERIVRDFFEGVQPRICRLSTGTGEATQAVAQDRSGRVELDATTLDELLAMLVWWKRHGKHAVSPATPVPVRPDFCRDSIVTKRISMNAQLWADADAVAKKQQELSGGTLSGLLEFLLWRHLGSADKYLK
jgi:hypothetical protein